MSLSILQRCVTLCPRILNFASTICPHGVTPGPAESSTRSGSLPTADIGTWTLGATPGWHSPLQGGPDTCGRAHRRAPEDHTLDSNADDIGNKPTAPLVPGPEATLVRLAIPSESAWVVEAVPVLDRSTLPDGRTVVTLGVVSTVWLERLLLQLGPDAEILEPAELRDLARDAAKRVLARYGEGADAADKH